MFDSPFHLPHLFGSWVADLLWISWPQRHTLRGLGGWARCGHKTEPPETYTSFKFDVLWPHCVHKTEPSENIAPQGIYLARRETTPPPRRRRSKAAGGPDRSKFSVLCSLFFVPFTVQGARPVRPNRGFAGHGGLARAAPLVRTEPSRCGSIRAEPAKEEN